MKRFAALALLGVLATLCGCRTNDVSFKSVTYEGVTADKAFDLCQKVIAQHFGGTKIRIDKARGRIETDPIEDQIAGKAMREQGYVHVQTLEDGRVEVALFARLAQLTVGSGAERVKWQDVGSDVKVEGILLDEISAEILALEPDARIVASTLPKDASKR